MDHASDPASHPPKIQPQLSTALTFGDLDAPALTLPTSEKLRPIVVLYPWLLDLVIQLQRKDIMNHRLRWVKTPLHRLKTEEAVVVANAVGACMRNCLTARDAVGRWKE